MADERKEEIILDFTVDVEDSIESIDKLTAANRELRKERNALNLTTDQGKKRAQEINAVIDQNTSKIKANVSAIEKQKINIGNYKSALDHLAPGLGNVAEGLQKGVTGFKGLSAGAKLFILTGIGAIIAALVAVFQLLSAALSKNDALMDKFENITNAVSVILEVVVGRVGKLGEALIALFSGNFDEALDLTASAFSGLADEIQNAVTQQQLFLDASRDLEDSQRNLRIETARQENVIKSLVVAAKNRNLTFDQQEDLLTRALKLEEDLVRTREDIARRDLVITARRLRADKEFQQSSEETFDQYIQRLLESSALAPDELDKIAEKVEALEQARGSSLAFQEKVENSLTAVQEKRAAALAKQNEELKKLAESQRVIDAINERNANRTERKSPLEDAFATEAKLSETLNEKIRNDLKIRQKYNDEYFKRKSENAKKAAEIEIDVERSKLAIVSNVIGASADLVRKDSEAYQILASAQALMNTYLAATAAYASGAKINPLFGAFSAAAAVAAGLLNVAKINGIEFAEGGWTGPGDKHKPAGIVHADEYVVPKRIVNSPIAQGHLSALESMRLRGYADGGLVQTSLSSPINQQLELLNIVKNLPPSEVSVKEINKVSRRVKVKESISKR